MASTGWLTTAVRDYMFGRTAWSTAGEVAAQINSLRVAAGLGPYTANGAVRRSLKELEAAGKLLASAGSRPVVYRWADLASAPPPGYVDFATRMQQATLAAAQPTAKDRRAELRQSLAAHIGRVSSDPTPKPAVEKEEEKPVTIVVRPNGQEYRVRKIGREKDVDFLRQMRDERIWTLLSGAPGTGKTSWIDAAFGAELVLFPGQESTTVDDLFGTWVADGAGQWEWVDGPATYAMKNGKVLFVDDITLINPKVLGALYPIMDGRDMTVIATHMVDVDADGNPWPDSKKHPEEVKAQPGFFVIGAHNPGTNGAVLADALSSRFKLQIEVTSDLDLAQSAGVPMELIHLARSLQTAITEGESGWMPQMRDLFDSAHIAKVAGIDFALANLAGKAPEDDREIVMSKINSVRGKSIKPLTLGGQI